MNYCSHCSAPVNLRIPPGDDRPRYVCESCGTVHYENPRLVVGCIPELDGRILMCLRAIQPRYGKWTLPAGFLENGETVAEGARRETREEARADVHDLKPYRLFDLTFINQVYVMFRATLYSARVGPGAESLEVKLFQEREIPWEQIAFPVIRETLQHYLEDRRRNRFPFRTARISIRQARKPSRGN